MSQPHVAIGEKYARDVINGSVLACKWVRLACERHFKDKKRAKARDFPYEFKGKPAEAVCAFAELLPHTKGRWAARRESFVLQPWQCFLLLSIFGWVHKAGENKGKRRFRRSMLLVPRKNGKSDLAARIGLYMFAADQEFGAEVLSGATSEKQAKEVFTPAHRMASRTKAFLDHYGVKVQASNLYIELNGSKFEPLIGKPGDGASPSCAIIDEYHEHDDDSLFDAMQTGMGAREQPMALIITTAGDNTGGPCYQMQQTLEKVLEGIEGAADEEFWGIVYTIDDEDDWTTEDALRKANPNYDVSVSASFLKSEQTFAIRNARKQGIFKTKHMDLWVGALQAYFNLQDWKACTKTIGDPTTKTERLIRPADFKGCPLFVGMDLASKNDIAAVYLVFKVNNRQYAGFGRFYIPGWQVENGENEHYRGWAAEKRLIVTGGDRTDFDEIEKDLLELSRDFGITQLAFDPTQEPMLVTHLQNAGIECVEFKKNVANFSDPMKTLDAIIGAGEFHHDGDPAMEWMMSNVVCPPRLLQKDLAISEKEKPENKIDGPDALITAMSRAMVYEHGSVYETRGIRTL